MVIVYPLIDALLMWFGCSTDTLPHARAYLEVYLIGTPFSLIYLGMGMLLVAQGDSRLSLAAVASGSVLNIALDAALIFGLHMGATGAAVASVVSQALSAVLVMAFLQRKKSTLRMTRASGPQAKLARRILGLGVGFFFVVATENVLYIVFNAILAASGGDSYIAIYTVFLSLLSLAMNVTSGFAQGAQPIVAYCNGAGLDGRARQCAKVMIIGSWAVCAAIALLVVGFPHAFMALFTNDADLIGRATALLPLFMSGMFVFGIQLAMQSLFVAYGHGRYPLIVAFMRKFVFMIPIALALASVTGPFGVFASEPAGDVLSVAFTCVLFYRKVWRGLRPAQDR